MDIAVAVSLALAAALMAYLGVHMTIHPPETPRARSRYKASFLTLGVLSIVLVAIQAKRNADVQGQIAAQLEGISQQTRQPPNITVNVPSPLLQVVPQAAPQSAPAKPRPRSVPSGATAQVETKSEHPVISFSRTRVTTPSKSSFNPVAVIALRNTGDDVQASVTAYLVVGAGSPLPLGQTRSLVFARGNEIELTLTPNLPHYADEFGRPTGDIALRVDVEYEDRGKTTTYVFKGRMVPNAETLDVERSEWIR